MIVDCIIPLFNKRNFISNAIKSAINQKIKKFNNIIIINDGSTDGSDLIVEDLSKKYPSIKIINQNNMGSSVARNEGIKNSNADYLVFLDADDQLHEKYLLALNLMKKKYPEAKVFSARHMNIYKNLKLIENSKKIKIYKSNIFEENNPILKYSFDPKLFCSSGIGIERKIFVNIKFPEGINVGEDIYTWLKIFETEKLVYLDKELVIISKISENRSIEIFNEIPFYLKKISEFNLKKNKTYFIYFLISSAIYLYQNKEEYNLNNFFSLIKKQSYIIYLILLLLNNPILFKIYKTFKNRKIQKENLKIYPDTENFYILSSNYFFILPGMPIILFTLYWNNNYVLISDILLMSSITVFVTSSISFYARPFYLITDNLKDALMFLKIKKILIFPLILFLILLQYFLDIKNILTLNISIFFLIYAWRNEADIAIFEFENSKKKLIHNLLEIIALKGLLILNILMNNLQLGIATIIIFLILLKKKNYFFFHKNNFFKLISSIRRRLNENWLYIFLNSFILNITNFLHRYIILLYIDKTYAGVLFFCFSMGSFPASLFNFVFSSIIIRNKTKFPKLGIFLLMIYLIMAVYIVALKLLNIDKSIIYNIFQKEHLEYVFYSMIGGILMSYALFKKNQIFANNNMKKIFLPELLYSFIILSIIPLVFYNFDLVIFKFIFLLNSITAFLIFIPLKIYFKNE
jgi:glycosyltransferase involved in cell wall biosynthesis